MSTRDEITIKVGFGDQIKELTVRIADGDIPPYQPGDKLKLVGSRASRVDALAKVTGRAKYTADRSLKGMLYGKIVRCPHANANVKNIDFSKAEKMPGVMATLSLAKVGDRLLFAGQDVAAVAASSPCSSTSLMRPSRL